MQKNVINVDLKTLKILYKLDVNKTIKIYIFFQIKNSVSARMEVNYKLEQDEMEGVDEEEWVE